MTTELAYIPDGYTVDGYIEREERLYPACRLKYRPATTQERSAYFSLIEREKDAKKEEEIAAEAIKLHVLSWDLKKPDGSAVEITVLEILRIQPLLFQKMFSVITGQMVGQVVKIKSAI